MPPIRLLVVDDHALFRRGLVSLFATDSEFEVVGEADNGAQALEKARALRPDIVLLDLRMPILDGFETLDQLKKERIRSHVIILTASDDDRDVERALAEGAKAYIPKTVEPHELFQKLRSVMGRDRPA